MSSDPTIISEELQETASVWLSRRDRGLNAVEQDAYLEWLYQDPLHGRAIVQLERVWASLNVLSEWRPAHSVVPNPDLLAPRRPSKIYWFSTAIAAAAAIAMMLYSWSPKQVASSAAHREAIVHPGPERQALADGSIVELNQGAKIDVRFTPGERHVRLVAGEAHFTVAKNPARPFFVDTDKVSVRAVGTAFSVSLAKSEVAVLVTEGKVQVLAHAAPSESPNRAPVLNPAPPIILTVGQRTVVSLDALAASPVVQDVTPAEIDRALSWQGLRLEFVDMRLGDVVAEFNRYNRQRLVVGDADTAAIIVGGNFRADNVDGFVRLLELSFGVKAESNGTETILRKAP